MKNNFDKLICPIRGELTSEKLSKDGLIYTEEYQRIECIKFLLSKGYKKEFFDLEKNIIKVGNKGKNKVRADIIIYNKPRTSLVGKELNEVLDYVDIVAEIKRKNEDKKDALTYQLKPAMKQINKDCYGVYWDDIERIFLSKLKGKVLDEENEISKFPVFGSQYEQRPLKFDDIKNQKVENFKKLLDQIDQRLHNSGLSKDRRYNELFKLFLCKFYDEKMKKNTDKDLDFQIYEDEKADSISFKERIQKLYGTDKSNGARQYYSINSPVDFSEELKLKWDVIYDVVKVLQGKNILGTDALVLQDFFVKFAPNVLKIDLAQYYTPINIIDAIIKICNIKKDDIIIDPAGGTGDFLTMALQLGREKGFEELKDYIYYWDSSEEAAKVAVLNMIINGDGRVNVKILDSIENYDQANGQFSLVLCNPPFGVKTTWEGNLELMNEYNLGVKWTNRDDGEISKYSDINKEVDKNGNYIPLKQQLGILFIERCLNLLRIGGRLGIILPNGYLSNPSDVYIREWLVENYRIIGVIGLPAGTFKKSGAAVTPSILFVENTKPKKLDYNIVFANAKDIGFDYTKKSAPIIYERDLKNGDFILESNKKVIMSDFPSIIKQFKCFLKRNNLDNWIGEDENIEDVKYVCVNLADILKDEKLILDSNRYSREYFDTVEFIKKNKYKTLAEIIELREETLNSHDDLNRTKDFYYVEIGNVDVGTGIIDYKNYKGWQVPGNRQYHVHDGDILISRVRTYRKGIALVDKDYDNILASKGGFVVIKDTKYIDKHSLYYFLRSELFIKQVNAILSGSAYPTLDEKDFDKIYVPVNFKLPKDEVNELSLKYNFQINILKGL